MGSHQTVFRQSYSLQGAPQLARPPRSGPCLDFGFQYALIRNNRSKRFGVIEYWALPGSNSPWRPCIEQPCKLKGVSVLFNLFFPKFCWLRPNYAEQHLSNEKIADIWLWVCRLVHKQRTNWWEVCLRLLRGLGPIMVPHTSISVTSHMEHNVAESIRGTD